MKGPLDQRMREARRRLRFERFVTTAAWILAGGWLACAIWEIARFATRGFPDSETAICWVIIAALALLAGSASALMSWRDPLAVARRIDRAGGTKDRFVSVLALGQLPDGPLIESEAARFSQTFTLPPSLNVRFPFRPSILIAFSLLLAAGTAIVESDKRTRLAPAVASAEATLARVKEEIRKQAGDEKTEDLKALEQAELQLAQSSDPGRDALRALSELEKRLSSAANAGPKPLSAAEATALAEALADKNPSLAAALANGPSSQTADQISRLDPSALSEALKQAARHVESSRLRDMLQQSGDETRQLLAQAYRPGAPSDGSARATSLLRAIREIKAGQNDAPEEGGDKGLAEANPGNDPAQSQDQKDAAPGGSAGQEKDLGTGEDLSPKDALAGKHGDRDILFGQAGDGPAELKVSRAAGADLSRAGRSLSGNTAYPTSAPLDAVEQENIPPGSQLLVRRYFEFIRPAE